MNNSLFPSKIKSEEYNFRDKFCQKYFPKNSWELETLIKVDVLLKGKKDRPLLYIESKHRIKSEAERREAIAQAILTNKKQEAPLSHVAIIYLDKDENDTLEYISWNDDSVMYNNDIKWDKETPSKPSKDAIVHINNRVRGKITSFKNEQIKEFYKKLVEQGEISINITSKNVHTVYDQWRSEVKFIEEIPDEQKVITLFLVDMLNGANYMEKYIEEYEIEADIWGNKKKLKRIVNTGRPLLNEGTELSHYTILNEGKRGILYEGNIQSLFYRFTNPDGHDDFWKRFKRPPEQFEFQNIVEHSNRLYSEEYRNATGGEYTPSCFVRLQNELLKKFNYDINEYIVFDPCSGVGNLENEFGYDFKYNCYLSTLESNDVDQCLMKGFENAQKYDYLEDNKHPLWKYKGRKDISIKEICKLEKKKLMIVMNPPYGIEKGFKYDKAIEFFIKVLTLEPDVIVYYCKTEFFLRKNDIKVFEDSGYNIVSHVFSNAKTTFKLSEWPISLLIFDKEKGKIIDSNQIEADRYELNKKTDWLEYIATYRYDNKRPCLIDSIESLIKDHSQGSILGQWTKDHYCWVISNRNTHNKYITSDNLLYTLVLKGIDFNTHAHYFEKSDMIYRGTFNDMSSELISNAVMFSLFYKGNNFSNKEGMDNYIMPFTSTELGCKKNDLNVLIPKQLNLFEEKKETEFDFRKFMSKFQFSKEAKELYNAALKIFKYYHHCGEYPEHNYNDGYYDIVNAIMNKDTSQFKTLEKTKDKRITKVRTTKGTIGFSDKTFKDYVLPKYWDDFKDFFHKRKAMAVRINEQLLQENLILWKRENIF